MKVDTITKQRIAAALIAWGREQSILPDVSAEILADMVEQGIESGNPIIMEGVNLVQKVVAAYYGATDLNLEITARAAIEMVANGNKAKRFVLPIIEGPGLGHWEMIVRRVRQEKPSLVVPTLAEKEKLW